MYNRAGLPFTPWGAAIGIEELAVRAPAAETVGPPFFTPKPLPTILCYITVRDCAARRMVAAFARTRLGYPKQGAR